MTYIVYSYPNNVRVWKILIVASYAGIAVEEASNFDMESRKTPEFLKKFPAGQVPAMDTPDGPLFESDAIAKYLARVGNVLYGSNEYEASLIDAWVDWSSNELVSHLTRWLYPVIGHAPFDEGVYKRSKESVMRSLGILNGYLLHHTYLVGNSISIADITICCTLIYLFTILAGPEFREPFGNVMRWFRNVTNQPKFLAVSGVLKFTEKEPEPRRVSVSKIVADVSKNTDVDTPEEDQRPKSKKVHPLDALPPTNFNLEDWKRFYSNNDTLTVAMPWFWEHYDENGWSIWFAFYNYNQDLKRKFMASNLAGGFIQRLDVIRKWAFGVVGVLGSEEEGLKIACCFLVRGVKLPSEIDPECANNYEGQYVDDAECYEWRKANIHDENDRRLIGEFFDRNNITGVYGPNIEFADSKVLK